MELNECREKIDLIDAELMRLIEQRFEMSEKIGEIKKQSKAAVYDKSREAEILEKIPSVCTKYKDETAELYSKIFELSRAIQK